MAVATVDLTKAPRISLTEAREKQKRGGDVVFVDVRKLEDYDEAHIPEAISIPIEQLVRRIGELPKGKEIIFY